MNDGASGRFAPPPIARHIAALLRDLDDFPIDERTVPQARLDLPTRSRTSILPWRGQFSPELVELLLTEFARPSNAVLDPFVGSGTTLFECAGKSMSCIGSEINPAAITLASTVMFAKLSLSQRLAYLDHSFTILDRYFPMHYTDGLFAYLHGPDFTQRDDALANLPPMLHEAAQSPYISTALCNVLLTASADSTRPPSHDFHRSFRCYKDIVQHLPHTTQSCGVLHSDARSIPIPDASIDFIITSPPYINVFNYHQNHRAALELMGWDMLRVAKSELGSNRKHRGNRFLTVIQYAMDMHRALCEMRRVIRPAGRVVIVVGRESNVRGVSFQNGRLVAALAVGGAAFRLALRQERKFKNKFGQIIYEDILHFSPTTPVRLGRTPASDLGRRIGQCLLEEAVYRADGDVRRDIEDAIRRAPDVKASPLFERRVED